MSAMDAQTTRRGTPLARDGGVARVSVTETWWGYVIRNEREISAGRRLLTIVSGFIAIAFALSSVALWLAPATVLSGDIIVMKAGGSSLMALLALLFAWLATEDPVVEIQVDCRRAELREVVRRAGDETRLLGRYGFEEIGGIFFDRAGPGRLVARYRNTPHLITIAEGGGPALHRIRDRLGRDVMGGTIGG